MSVLEIRDLHVTVETDEGTTPILNGVTLTLRTGEPTGPPAIVPIAVHTVRIEGDDVYVALSEES